MGVTVLVAEMDDGCLLLYGWQDRTYAYLCPQDAEPLKQALATAFGIADVTTRTPGEL